jgi:mannose-6-phosphate isomerase class I
MVLATGGRIELSANGESLTLSSGEAAFIPFAHRVYTLRPTRPESVAWRVGIGQL